jgi:hypothetical protein
MKIIIYIGDDNIYIGVVIGDVNYVVQLAMILGEV